MDWSKDESSSLDNANNQNEPEMDLLDQHIKTRIELLRNKVEIRKIEYEFRTEPSINSLGESFRSDFSQFNAESTKHLLKSKEEKEDRIKQLDSANSELENTSTSSLDSFLKAYSKIPHSRRGHILVQVLQKEKALEQRFSEISHKLKRIKSVFPTLNQEEKDALLDLMNSYRKEKANIGISLAYYRTFESAISQDVFPRSLPKVKDFREVSSPELQKYYAVVSASKSIRNSYSLVISDIEKLQGQLVSIGTEKAEPSATTENKETKKDEPSKEDNLQKNPITLRQIRSEVKRRGLGHYYGYRRR